MTVPPIVLDGWYTAYIVYVSAVSDGQREGLMLMQRGGLVARRSDGALHIAVIDSVTVSAN